MRTLAHVKLKQVLAQANARQVVDDQYFAQRRAEKMKNALDNIECEANAPRGPVHAFSHLDSNIKL